MGGKEMVSATKYFFTVSTSVFTLFFICSCSLLPQPDNIPVCYYDLGIPEQAELSAGKVVTVLPFSSLSGERFRMVQRTKFLLENDDNNKWQMPPGSLVTKYLTLFFRQDLSSGGNTARSITLGGTVTAFENDGENAVLGLVYRITFPGVDSQRRVAVQRNILIKEKLLNNKPASFASAMAKAMKKAAECMVKDINSK